MVIEKILTDSELIIGLDYLYREYMKLYETNILLKSTQKLVKKLSITLKSYPIEGYYYESDNLKKYFTLVQNLKEVSMNRKNELKNDQDYENIIKIFTSPIYGEFHYEDSILPIVNDPINDELNRLDVNEWQSSKIIENAYNKIKIKRFFH